MATSTETRTSPRGLPQPTDLLLVQRGNTPYRATADEVKAFMLTPATAAAIGAIRPGTNLSVDADGTLHAAIPGALTTGVRSTPPATRPRPMPLWETCIWPVPQALPWPAGVASPGGDRPRGSAAV